MNGQRPHFVFLDEAQEWLRQHVDEGARCPCCTQYAKVYRWSLYGSIIKALILLHRVGGTTEFSSLRDIRSLGYTEQGGATRLRFWNLAEEERVVRSDGGKAGYWRVTSLGEAFILGRIAIPKYAYVYDNRLLRLDGERVNVRDVLGTRFSYDELMSA